MVPSVPVALVTGASRGLGRGIALELAKRGFSVAVNYASNKEAAEETVSMCRQCQTSSDQRFVPIQSDIGLAQDRERLLRGTLKAFPQLDALVNNAGIGPAVRVDVTQTTEESLRQVLQVNLHGPFFLTQGVVKYWLKDKPKFP